MHILVIKTTSLGDILHALPAIEDASRAIPDITFDWVAEAPFADVPLFHPAVKQVIPVRIRYWRKHLLSAKTWDEMKSTVQVIHEKQYDHVIDAQGLIKSAILTSFARGKKSGFSKHCAREPLSAYFYDQKVDVPRDEHAISRMRLLFATVLGYEVNLSDVQYGLAAVNKKTNTKPALVFLHGTTWPTKHWPETYWITLVQLAHAKGYEVLVPWGNDVERARAESIAQNGMGKVLSKMSLTDLAVILKSATGVISGDTGLGHLAAALDVPCLSLYGPSDPTLTGPRGKYVKYLSSTRSCAPCLSESCVISDMKGLTDPPCLGDFTPAQVFAQLQLLLAECPS